MVGPRILNSVSRRRSLVGRSARPFRLRSVLLRYFPAITRMGRPFATTDAHRCTRMRKKQKRLEIGNQDRLNSDFATLVVLGSYFPSSKVVLFLYPCSSVCIRGFKALTRRTPADIAAAILAEAGRAGAGAPAPRRGIPRATAPRGARVRAGRNRAADSRYGSRVRHAGACQRNPGPRSFKSV